MKAAKRTRPPKPTPSEQAIAAADFARWWQTLAADVEHVAIALRADHSDLPRLLDAKTRERYSLAINCLTAVFERVTPRMTPLTTERFLSAYDPIFSRTKRGAKK
ncbi:MAG: hypothetical protein JWO38_7680 [Gemmataceae bacterium]|nr:hypothetical protein [Gemmataceae bacterium]